MKVDSCFLDPNTVFDFKPVNYQMLLHSRLCFALKKDRLQKYMLKHSEKKKVEMQEKGYEQKVKHEMWQRWKDQWKQESDRQLSLLFPKYYKEYFVDPHSHIQPDIISGTSKKK